MVLASIGSFFDSVGEFFSNLARVHWPTLILGLILFGIYLTLRSRAWFHVLRAAYPDEPFQWRKIWAAYMAAYGFNNIVPARGGDVMKLFLTKSTIPKSSYPALGSTMLVEGIYDLTIAVPVLTFAFTQGVFPKPPDFAKLGAFDLSLFAGHMKGTLFAITVLGVAVFVGFAVLSARVRAFWARVKQGFVILKDRRKYIREVWLFQFVGWLFRFSAFWCLLDAFGIGGSVKNVMLVLGCNAVAAVIPFTPGGAGVVQALLVKCFGSSSVVAAYSVGQQIAVGAFCLGVGFVALVTVFQFRSFKEVINAGKEARAGEDERDVRRGPAEPRARA
ncbi:MAG: hypothetical protein QOF76_2706 [Solirubrobacteraceae bacterium]|nr:hypothetical protein [Solirubrobacteraceae bacterium]